jgi:hypothetical protein
MMNGLGKSDRPIVPMRSPNNAGPPAAEGREGRGLAKGMGKNNCRPPFRDFPFLLVHP